MVYNIAEENRENMMSKQVVNDTIQHCSIPEHSALISSLTEETIALKKQVQDLKAQLKMNSTNSSKPPASDGYEKSKPKSQRVKTGKKPGGQAGHTGETLKQVDNPDIIKDYAVAKCYNCGADLSAHKADGHECRQEFDVQPPEPVVTEHRAEIKLCPQCRKITVAAFPTHITQKAQYGARVKSYAVYFNQQQFIPYKRLNQVLADCFKLPVCQGTLVSFNNVCANYLSPTMNAIQDTITNSNVAHFDESGMRVNGKLHWLHVSSTNQATYYFIHKNRGSKAMDAINILPSFEGKAIHDHWSAYMKYPCNHGLCNSHHIRELTFSYEHYGQEWSKKMITLLTAINKKVDAYKLKKKAKLGRHILKRYSNEYTTILTNGLLEIPTLTEPPKKKRGKTKQHKIKNLWDRLVEHKTETLLFMYDFNVPFTNNLAERDVRMCKVKQKISGTFRSYRGAETFTTIRSYISTMRKQGCNVLESLTAVFAGKPFSIQ